VINYAAGLLFLAASATAAGAETLASCARIDAADARLACYDALAHRPADRIPSVSAVKPPAAAAQISSVAAAPAAAPAAATAATGAAAPAPVPATAAPVSAAALAAQDPNNFGLSLAQQHVASAGPTSIKARIAAINPGPNGQTYLVLDSGQTWTMGENDGWLSTGDAVTIKRAALGSFLLTAPSNHSYHVRRVQ
jgi:hypothetical protein